MPAHFNDNDRDRIRQQLMTTARELFASHGLAKTTIADLIAPAGISPGSFYAFFASKEALYLELLLADGPAIGQRLLAPLAAPADTYDAIRDFLHGVIHEQESNPLLRRLIRHPEELQALARHLAQSPDHQQRQQELSVLPLTAFVEQAQRQGQLVAGDPQVLAAVLRAVTVLPLHADDIGAEVFPQALDLVIDLVARGLAAAPPKES